MVSARPPAPSIGLLRFLRSQSENLSFFSPSHANCIGQASRRATLCPARRQLKTGTQAVAAPQYDTQLQSSVLDIQRLFSARAPKDSRLLRTKRTAIAALSSGAGVRYRSSDDSCAPTLKERLWGPRTRKLPNALKPDDLPEHDEDGDNNSMFNTRRQRAQQAALEPRLRCTEVDENGNAILVDGEFKKTELIARVSNLGPHPISSILADTVKTVWAPTP